MGFFTECMGGCRRRLDNDGDGHISFDEVVMAGSKAVVFTRNFAEVMATYAGIVGGIWNVNVSGFTNLVAELNTTLDVASEVLTQIKNFPRLPKNTAGLKAMIDTNGDGTLSAIEVDAFLEKTKNAFKQAEDYCLKHHLDFKPVKACSDVLNRMILTLQAINQGVEAAKANPPASSVVEIQPADVEDGQKVLSHTF